MDENATVGRSNRGTYFLIGFIVLLVGGYWWTMVRSAGMALTFWRAIETGDVEAVTAHLNAGVSPNFLHKEGDAHEPALIAALRVKSDDVVQALLERGADPNIRMGGGGGFARPALVVAVENADREANSVNALLAKGADVNARDGYGFTALIAASGANRLDLVTLLLEKGADPNAVVGHSHPAATALYSAIEQGNAPMVALLLDKGADPNPRFYSPGTLRKAARGNSDILALLSKANQKKP